MATPALRLLPTPAPSGRPDLAVELRTLRREMADAKRDLLLGIDAAYAAAWSGNRAYVINQLGRLGLRVQAMPGKESPRPPRRA